MLGAYDPFSFSPVTFNPAFSPLPTPSAGDNARIQNMDPYDTDADNLKWSIYVTKTIHEKIRFSGKLASDHWRIPNNNSVTTDVTVKPSQFYLSMKLEYVFK